MVGIVSRRREEVSTQNVYQQENDYYEKDNTKRNMEGRTSSQGKGQKVKVTRNNGVKTRTMRKGITNRISRKISRTIVGKNSTIKSSLRSLVTSRKEVLMLKILTKMFLMSMLILPTIIRVSQHSNRIRLRNLLLILWSKLWQQD